MENKSYLMVTKDEVKFNPTIEDEENNPGAYIIKYSYFDKFNDEYFLLTTESFIKDYLYKDIYDNNLYGKNKIVVECLMWYISKNFYAVGI